jgi:hypothetical protein
MYADDRDRESFPTQAMSEVMLLIALWAGTIGLRFSDHEAIPVPSTTRGALVRAPEGLRPSGS